MGGAADSTGSTASTSGASAPDAPRGFGRVALAAGLLAIACVLAWVPFGADVQRAERVPPAAAVTAATDRIRAEFQPGDAVVVLPSWFVDPWRALQNAGPGTEAWPFPALFSSENVDPIDALAYRRLWVLASFGLPADPPAVLAADAGARLDLELPDAPGVALARYELPSVHRLRTLSKELARLDVARSWAGPLERCKPGPDRIQCGHESWYDITIDDHIVYHEHVHWLYTHPGPRGPLEITWRALQTETTPAAGVTTPTWLFVRIGHTLQAVRQPEGKPVTLTILVGDREVDQVELGPRRYWMERRALRLDTLATHGKRVDVTFRLTTEDNGWRETMMEVDVLDALPASLRAWATHVVE